MEGYIWLYASINELYNFKSGHEGFGYTKPKDDHFNIGIAVPINRIVIGNKEEQTNSYLVRWEKNTD